MKSVNKKTGEIGEKIAAKFLLDNGYSIVERNLKFKIGEIDIIATKNNTIHFIEVKSKNSNLKGDPFQRVDYKKIRKLTNLVSYYAKIKHLYNHKHSIDIVSVIFNFNTNKHKIKIYENVTN